MIEGNYYNKYESGSSIVSYIMSKFNCSLASLLALTAPSTSVYEVGCGEGYLAEVYTALNFRASGSDISERCVKMANERFADTDYANSFHVKNVYDLEKSDINDADIVLCCEVLEHLEEPLKALEVLAALNASWYIFSVPREPIWRVLNMCRGRYISSLGNTPGHLQHWSKSSFLTFIEKHFEIVAFKTPLPWTMLLCKSK